MNVDLDEEGLVPYGLVFGILRRFVILNTNLPEQKTLMEHIKIVHAEKIQFLQNSAYVKVC